VPGIVARLYADAASAGRAAQSLRTAGVAPEAISVLTRSTEEADAIERTTGASDDLEDAVVRRHPLEDFVDWLGRVESAVVPGFGAVLGTGDLWQDVARGAHARGAITGALVGLGIDVDDASRYEAAVRGGEVLLVVDTSQASVAPDAINAILDPLGA
jgi:hypothetical protein